MRRASMPSGGATFAGSRICAANAYCFSLKVVESAMRHLLIAGFDLKFFYPTNLVEQFFHWREIKVSLQQRRDRTKQFVGFFQQCPRLAVDRRTVSVDSEVFVLNKMSSQVEIANAIR